MQTSIALETEFKYSTIIGTLLHVYRYTLSTNWIRCTFTFGHYFLKSIAGKYNSLP